MADQSKRAGANARLGLSHVNADKVVMALSTDEMLAALNIPLQVRRGRLVLDYKTNPFPVLMLSAPGVEAEPLCRIHTRGSAPWTETVVPRDSTLRLIAADIAERMAKVPATLVLAHSKDVLQRKYVRLQILHAESRYVALTLHGTWKGHVSGPLGPFAAPELKMRNSAATREVAHGL